MDLVSQGWNKKQLGGRRQMAAGALEKTAQRLPALQRGLQA